MSKDIDKEDIDKEKRIDNSGTSTCERDKRYKETYRATRDHRAAVRSYCAGNKWATENAKAVGNW